MAIYGELTNSIVRQINRSRRPVTILFTDIEDSTQYWDKYGDVKGRLMVDQHNRLTFPVIRHFHGRIIKTIGDAIMASFKKPGDAVKAAIGIQQALEDMRQQDSSFQMRVRIGVHTGKAIVEDADVFGDVVNVAARVESQGKGNEILLSASTARTLLNEEYCLVKHGSFAPKGKRKMISLYRCEWHRYHDLTRDLRYRSWLPLVPRQKKELLIYITVFVAVLYFIYLKYIRYFIADSEDVALLFLNPSRLIEEQPVALGIAAFVLLSLLLLYWRSKSIPRFLLHLVKGGFGFAVVFMLLYWPVQYLNFDWGDKWNGILHKSSHLFVNVLEDGASVYERPTITSKELIQVRNGNLLLLADVVERHGFEWNKVLIGPQQYGWIERITPRNRRVTLTQKFYFRYKDLYPLLIGLLGFIWGVLDFRVKPT
jgi:class 3 adenylate cyclase